MRANQVGMVRRRQIIPMVAKLRINADCLQRLIDLVAIGQQLFFSPSLAGVAQNVDEILRAFGDRVSCCGLREDIRVHWLVAVHGTNGALRNVF